jgi:hypothetical protein
VKHTAVLYEREVPSIPLALITYDRVNVVPTVPELYDAEKQLFCVTEFFCGPVLVCSISSEFVRWETRG